MKEANGIPGLDVVQWPACKAKCKSPTLIPKEDECGVESV